ncbi:MAG: hypothetical protein ACXWRE_04275 [Pseudobdellovibrionaceae bacterium]
MDILNYEFENVEDREMAYHNIEKWYGSNVAERVECLKISVQASKEVMAATGKIMEKHFGRKETGL